jgi:formate-dependent nitrite reductase membrane component NrfD
MGWMVITYLFLGGAGAGLFLVSLYMTHPWGEALGLMLLLIGTLFLMLDLGRPGRFWRAFFRARTSWISRGCFFISALVLLGGLNILIELTVSGSGMLTTMIRVGAGAAAVAVMIYTGFVLSPSAAIPFGTRLLPDYFFAYSLLAGSIFDLASPILPSPAIDVAHLEKFSSAWCCYVCSWS